MYSVYIYYRDLARRYNYFVSKLTIILSWSLSPFKKYPQEQFFYEKYDVTLVNMMSQSIPICKASNSLLYKGEIPDLWICDLPQLVYPMCITKSVLCSTLKLPLSYHLCQHLSNFFQVNFHIVHFVIFILLVLDITHCIIVCVMSAFDHHSVYSQH